MGCSIKLLTGQGKPRVPRSIHFPIAKVCMFINETCILVLVVLCTSWVYHWHWTFLENSIPESSSVYFNYTSFLTVPEMCGDPKPWELEEWSLPKLTVACRHISPKSDH